MARRITPPNVAQGTWRSVEIFTSGTVELPRVNRKKQITATGMDKIIRIKIIFCLSGSGIGIADAKQQMRKGASIFEWIVLNKESI